MLWTYFVDLLRSAILATSQLCNGNLGLAVCLVSLTMRLVLLPVSLRLARRALAHQRRMHETTAFYARRNIKQIDRAGLLGALVQVPIFGALFDALRRGLGAGVRFFWIGDLAKPSVLLTLLVTLLTVAGAAVAPPIDASRRMAVVPMLMIAGATIWFLSSTSALFGLASGAGALVNVIQALFLRQGDRKARSAV
jgi:YidC/Oxa1 family membrane protein insertase